MKEPVVNNPYAPKDKEFYRDLDDRQHRLTVELAVCRKVEATLNSEGWREIIGPTLDRMIIDVVGGKHGNTWYYGELQKARSDEKRSFYVGYKQGLIKFHNQLMNHKKLIATKESQLKAITTERTSGFQVPMIGEVEDSAEEES